MEAHNVILSTVFLNNTRTVKFIKTQLQVTIAVTYIHTSRFVCFGFDLDYASTFFRYMILAPTAVSGGFMDGKKACEKLLDAMQLEKASYRVGTSKVIDMYT